MIRTALLTLTALLLDPDGDPDNDTFPTNVELAINTNPLVGCGLTGAEWAPDFDGTESVGVLDLLAIAELLNLLETDPRFDVRLDIGVDLGSSAPRSIGLLDMFIVAGLLNQTCSTP